MISMVVRMEKIQQLRNSKELNKFERRIMRRKFDVHQNLKKINKTKFTIIHIYSPYSFVIKRETFFSDFSPWE